MLIVWLLGACKPSRTGMHPEAHRGRVDTVALSAFIGDLVSTEIYTALTESGEASVYCVHAVLHKGWTMENTRILASNETLHEFVHDNDCEADDFGID